MRPVVATLIASDKPSSRVPSDNGTGVVSEESPGTVMKSRFAPPHKPIADYQIQKGECVLRRLAHCSAHFSRPSSSDARPLARPTALGRYLRPCSAGGPGGLGGRRAVPREAGGVWERHASRAPSLSRRVSGRWRYDGRKESWRSCGGGRFGCCVAGSPRASAAGARVGGFQATPGVGRARGGAAAGRVAMLIR